jgi:hypothetical protein
MHMTTLCRLLEKVPDAVLSLLPYAIPVLGERLARYDSTKQAESYAPEISSSSCTVDVEKSGNGTETNNATGMPTPARSGPVEEVEENRLLLAKLLRSVLRHSGKAIGAYAADVAAMLMSSVADPSPEVSQELCACCEDYAVKLGLRLRHVAKSMIGAVTPLLGAKRQKVRCSALRAIRKLVACGGSEAVLDLTGFRDPNLIPVKAFYEADTKVGWKQALWKNGSASSGVGQACDCEIKIEIQINLLKSNLNYEGWHFFACPEKLLH